MLLVISLENEELVFLIFLQLNSLFLITFLFEKSLCFWRAETPFSSIHFSSRFPGGNSSKISDLWNLKFAHNSWLKAPRSLLESFFKFKYFSCFWSWNQCYLTTLFWKKKFLEGWDAFSVYRFSSRFPGGKSLLNFWILKFKICS